jgi:hypothetical protein
MEDPPDVVRKMLAFNWMVTNTPNKSSGLLQKIKCYIKTKREIIGGV